MLLRDQINQTCPQTRTTPRKDSIPRTDSFKLLFPSLLSHQPKVLLSLRAHLGTYVVAMGPRKGTGGRTNGWGTYGDWGLDYTPL